MLLSFPLSDHHHKPQDQESSVKSAQKGVAKKILWVIAVISFFPSNQSGVWGRADRRRIFGKISLEEYANLYQSPSIIRGQNFSRPSSSSILSRGLGPDHLAPGSRKRGIKSTLDVSKRSNLQVRSARGRFDKYYNDLRVLLDRPRVLKKASATLKLARLYEQETANLTCRPENLRRL